jgi:hypothetical protein
MHYKRSKFVCAVIGLCICTVAQAQESRRLTCKGTIRDVPAVLSGVRQYAPYNALGDGYVQFSGTVSAGGISGRIAYEGYTRTAPFSGVILTLQREFSIGVLDNTGGQMIIYSGTPSLGPPDEIGRFLCVWQ